MEENEMTPGMENADTDAVEEETPVEGASEAPEMPEEDDEEEVEGE